MRKMTGRRKYLSLIIAAVLAMQSTALITLSNTMEVRAAESNEHTDQLVSPEEDADNVMSYSRQTEHETEDSFSPSTLSEGDNLFTDEGADEEELLPEDHDVLDLSDDPEEALEERPFSIEDSSAEEISDTQTASDEDMTYEIADEAEDDFLENADELAAPAGTLENPAASCGAEEFATLQEAIGEANDGDTVTLLRDVTEAVTISTDSLTLDLDGKTLTVPHRDSQGKNVYGIRIIGDGITIENGFLSGKAVGGGIYLKGDTFIGRNLTFSGFETNKGFISGASSSDPIEVNDSDNVTFIGCDFSNCSAKYGVISIFDAGDVTIKSCRFEKNTSDNSIIHSEYSDSVKMVSCLFKGNIVKSNGTICADGVEDLNVTDTVITGNKALESRYTSGGIYFDGESLTISGGAIYDNHAGDDPEDETTGPDIYISDAESVSIPAASSMSDGAINFSPYFWYCFPSGKSVKESITGEDVGGIGYAARTELFVARIGDTGYSTLADAVAAATDEDTIQLCSRDYEGSRTINDDTVISVSKNITIDLKGHHLKAGDGSGKLFLVEEGGALTLTSSIYDSETGTDASGTNELDGSIENLGDLTITGSLHMPSDQRITHTGNNFHLSGTHDTLKIELGKDKYIEADEELVMQVNLEVYLLDQIDMDVLNRSDLEHEDILIVKGGNEALENVTLTPEITNAHVRKLHKGDGLYLVDKLPKGIYLDGVNGDDSNDGTEASPVKTFEKAKELLRRMAEEADISETKAPDGIYIMNTVTVADSQSWSFSDLPGGSEMEVLRYSEFTGVPGGTDRTSGVLVKVTGDLSLSDIRFNGLADGGVIAYAPLLDADGGTLNVNGGTKIADNTNGRQVTASISSGKQRMLLTAGGISGQNGGIINLNDGIVTGNRAGAGGGIGLFTGASLNMNGGTVTLNHACRRYNTEYDGNELGAAGGGGISRRRNQYDHGRRDNCRKHL